MSVMFWKGSELCRVLFCRSSLTITDVTGELGSLSRFLCAVSTKPDYVACVGSHSDLAKTIDVSEFYTPGVQSCFRFEYLTLSKLIPKSSFSVFGKIDFFSVLKALVVSLGDSLTEGWAVRSPEHTKVTNLVHNTFTRSSRSREDGTPCAIDVLILVRFFTGHN